MSWITRHKLAVGAVALAFAAAGGGAYAATQSSSDLQGAFLSDVAHRLHVSPQRLTAAMKAATIDRLNAAVKAGRLSPAQAAAIKQHIESQSGPPFIGPGVGPDGFPHGPDFFFGGPPPIGPLGAAASYLGLSPTQLFNDLRSGRSLAHVTKSQGKSVGGLENAMSAAVKSRLDQAVKAGRLSKPQEQRILSVLATRLHDFITRAGPVQIPAAPWRRPGGVEPLPIPGF